MEAKINAASIAEMIAAFAVVRLNGAKAPSTWSDRFQFHEKFVGQSTVRNSVGRQGDGVVSPRFAALTAERFSDVDSLASNKAGAFLL
jgi:hypothetical protein